MIIAAPLVAPFAKALGLSVGMLGMGKATDLVNKYIQENPEQSEKIISMIMPAQGIASVFERRGIGDNNPPSPIEEEKPPQKEPPKEPNVGEEILTNLATRELEKKVKDKSGVQLPTSLTTENFLKPKLLDNMLKLQGGIEGHRKLFEKDPDTGFSAAPMPGSTKKKMYNELSEIIDDK